MSRSRSNNSDDTVSMLSTESIFLQDLPYHDPVQHRHVHSLVDDYRTETDAQPLTRSSFTDKKYVDSQNTYNGATQPISSSKGRLQRLTTTFRRWILQSGPAEYRQISSPPARLTLGLQGWRLGVLVSVFALSLCLLLEIVLLITANVLKSADRSQGILFEGACEKVKKYTLLTLIPFNLVGTLMIGCSNYVMQVISAPSRREIDNAHNHGEDLNIGISSAQNSRWTAWWKNRAWYVIGVTTIPIHLMLNSVVFATLQSNAYDVVIAGPNFLDSSSNQTCSGKLKSYNISTSTASYLTGDPLVQPFNVNGHFCYIHYDYLNNSRLYESLDPTTCMERYQNSLQGGASNLILITNGNETLWNEMPQTANISTTIKNYYPGQLPLLVDSSGIVNWTQNSVSGNFASYNYSGLPTQPSTRCITKWNNTNLVIECNFSDQNRTLQVETCLSKKTEEHCTMQYSLTILVCILVCDLLKLIAMWFILNKILKRRQNLDKDDEIIAVLGDAIASFIERPDETSTDRCLIDQRQIRAVAWPMTANPSRGPNHPFWNLPLEARTARFPKTFGPRPQLWRLRSNRWATGPSRTRWIVFAALFATLFAAAIVIFVFSLRSLGDISFQNIWKQGVGKVDPSNVFALNVIQSSLIEGAIIINLPQLLFSYLYFAYNGLFTCMHAGFEWSQFTDPRGKTLRVSTPKPRQRSTYWLSLPWRYSLPLIATSTLLHWLVSQSLFLVKINVFDAAGIHSHKNDIAACGFSPMALLLVLVTLTVMIIVAVVIGSRKLKSGIPVVGTCSWAISAACHDQGGHADAAEGPLMWGVVSEGDGVVPGHCSITSRQVAAPTEGGIYQ